MPERVIVAEDERLARGALAGHLRHQGFEVVEAEHGEAALRFLSDATAAVDLVITDLDMPRINRI